jgi:hypothetical protein
MSQRAALIVGALAVAVSAASVALVFSSDHVDRPYSWASRSSPPASSRAGAGPRTGPER